MMLLVYESQIMNSEDLFFDYLNSIVFRSHLPLVLYQDRIYRKFNDVQYLDLMQFFHENRFCIYQYLGKDDDIVFLPHSKESLLNVLLYYSKAR